MNRTLPQLLDQRTSQLPQRKVYNASIYAVLFPSHQLVVNFPGHSRVVADVGNEVDFGTQTAQLVTRGMVVKVTLDDITGHWIASSPSTSNVCIPTTPANMPNVPLPVYQPPIPYFPPPIFPPSLPPIPPIILPPWTPPSVLPPTGTNTYDFGDWLPSVLAGITSSSVGFESNRAFTITRIAATTTGSDCTLNIYFGTAFAAIVVIANVDGTWTVERHNPIGGALISTWTSGVVNSFVRTFSGTDLLSVAAVTYVKSTLTAGAVDVTNFFWSCGGVA